jgi:Zn-dependent protease
MPNEIILIAFYIIILLYSVIIHEVSHGVVALWLGDPTAKHAGRLNLRPMSHIDPWGSIVTPLFFLFLSGFRYAFGWAKPVPYNPYNLRDQKWGPALVALGGPASNILIALFAAISARLLPITLTVKTEILGKFLGVLLGQNGFMERWYDLAFTISNSFVNIFFVLLLIIIFWNVILAFFNLIPLPPLDGSKLLFAVFPIRIETMMTLERFGLIFIIILLWFFGGIVSFFLNFILSIFFSIAV